MDDQNDSKEKAIKDTNDVSYIKEKWLTNKDSFSDMVTTRVGKLTTAIYLVSENMTLSDPLRLRMRELGVVLIAEAQATSNIESTPYYDRFFELASTLRELLSILSIAQTVGMISQMNHEILEREFLLLLDRVEHKRHIDGGYADGSAVHVTDEHALEQLFAQQLESNGQSFSKRHQNDTISSQGQKTVPVRNKTYSKALETGMRIERKNIILKLLKDKGEVTVNDITNVVTDCSEKTIQRILNRLIKEGVVQKEGKRRWSKYSLA